MKFVLGIGGSPRKGNSEWMLKKTIDQIRGSGVMAEMVFLRNCHINFCDGCLKCEENGKCHLSDDMQAIYKKILDANMLLIATPVHFDSVPGMLKNFIDRLNPLLYNDRLKEKYIGVLVVGQLTGEEGRTSRKRVIEYMKTLAEICKMNFVGFVEAEARIAGDVESKEIEGKCMEFGNRITGKLVEQ